MRMIWENVIQAADFAGFVPASRGARLPPPAPQSCLSLFPRNRNHYRPASRPATRGRFIGPRSPETATGLQPLPTGAARHGAGNHKNHIYTLPYAMIINPWRNFPDGVAVI